MLCIIADPSDCMALAVTCKSLKVIAIRSLLHKRFTFAPCSIRMLSACPHGDERGMTWGRAAGGGGIANLQTVGLMVHHGGKIIQRCSCSAESTYSASHTAREGALPAGARAPQPSTNKH